MSDGLPQFPKRSKGRVEVRHRTGPNARRETGVPQVEKIKAPRRKHDEEDEMSGQRRVVRRVEAEMNRRFVIAAVLLCVVLVSGVIWFLVIRPSGQDRIADSVGSMEPPRALLEEVEVSPLVANASAAEIEAAIEAVVRGFMTSKTDEERCLWVNGGTKVLERMKEFYSREGEEAPAGFERIVTMSAIPFGGVPMQVVEVSAPDEEESYMFNVFPGKERMLIDWESSVGYGEMEWAAFLENTPTEPVEMRVFLQLDDYYNYEYSDDQKYQCFSLGTKGSENTLFGYVELGSEVALRMTGSMPERGALPVRVKLKFLPWSVDKKMVLIEEFIHAFWVDPVTIEATLEQ